MKNWQQDDDDEYCSTQQDLIDAQKVCDVLKIPLHTVNFATEYWDKVFQHFLDEYAAMRTPNPDVLCNKEIKFRAFLDYAKNLGADKIATGHYARISTTPVSPHCLPAGSSSFHLRKGLDPTKDQSYFLYLLNQEQLAPSMFPLGDLTKVQVRQIAQEANLPNHAKKDSTGICFIGERKFKTFLSQYLLAKPGDIATTDGKIIGKHTGLMFYTIGQRQGLNVGGQKNAAESPWYVTAKDTTNNHLIVTQDRDHSGLSAKKLTCDQIHWISGQEPNMPFSCSAKIRYRQQDQACIVHKINNNELSVEFSASQWAITPGQSIVFYQQDECLGGGIIV